MFIVRFQQGDNRGRLGLACLAPDVGPTLRAYTALLRAMEQRLKNVNRSVASEIRALRRKIEQEAITIERLNWEA